jgi:hypothetical protein
VELFGKGRGAILLRGEKSRSPVRMIFKEVRNIACSGRGTSGN